MQKDDVIYRQAAIDACIRVRELRAYDEIEEIKALPSAQPEIIYCKDCKWKNRHNCTRAVEVPIDDDKYCAWAERRTDE